MLERDDFTISKAEVCDLCYADLSRQQKETDFWTTDLFHRMCRPCVTIAVNDASIDLCATHLLQLLARLIAQEPTQ